MNDEEAPNEAVAVSPLDQSSDREQSDADHSLIVEKLDEISTSEASDANTAIIVKKLDRLTTTAEQATIASNLLAASTVAGAERDSTSSRRFRTTMVVIGISVAALLVAMLVSLGSAAKSRAQLRDCITPTGKCYQDGQKRTAELVGNLNDSTVRVSGLAAACAPEYVDLPLAQRQTAILACIVRGLK